MPRSNYSHTSRNPRGRALANSSTASWHGLEYQPQDENDEEYVERPYSEPHVNDQVRRSDLLTANISVVNPSDSISEVMDSNYYRDPPPQYSPSDHTQGSQYPGSQYPGSQYQGSQYQSSQHQGSQYQGSQHQGSQHQGPQHGSSHSAGFQYQNASNRSSHHGKSRHDSNHYHGSASVLSSAESSKGPHISESNGSSRRKKKLAEGDVRVIKMKDGNLALERKARK